MRSPRLGLRGKFLLVAALTATLPWFGVQFVRETEGFLRDGLQRSVDAAAAALALAVAGRLGAAADPARDGPVLYAQPLDTAPQIDGYDADWHDLEPQARVLEPATDAAASARYLFASEGDHAYLLVRVEDADILYSDPRGGDPGDAVELLLHDARGVLRRYRLRTAAPGWVSAYERLASGQDRYEPRIRAEWQPRAGGYTVEIRLPRSLLAGGDLGLVVEDRDSGGPLSERAGRAALAWREGEPLAMDFVLPSAELSALLGAGGLVPGRRVRVTDTRGYVLARVGSLAAIAAPEPVNPVVAWLLPAPDARRLAALPDPPRLDGPRIARALAGETLSDWRETGQDGVHVVAALAPVLEQGRVSGVVVVEESTSAVLSARRRALAGLFDLSLLTGLLGTLALLAFAARVTGRLRRLRDDAERAVDRQGRILGDFPAVHGSDEIADLGRSFSAMLDRLRGYNDYLENLARRLSHELRTPLAVVRSSLEAEVADPESAADYRARAHGGVDRLDAILTRMAEASRIERAVQGGERELLRLDEFLAETVAAWRTTFAPRRFELELPEGALTVRAAPDLLAQMLDKLVANALDFGPAGSAVRIRLERRAESCLLQVVNQGPPLPGNGARIFDSMVSIREHRRPGDEQPHLGLGLYIVRLVAESHGWRVAARNLEDGSGVSVGVELPLA